MALGSNNPFPKVILVEQGSTPSTPSAGQQKVFARTSDGHVCAVDDAGAVRDLEAVQQVLTSDPAAPINDTGWFFDDGGSPATLYFKWRKGGVTYSFPIGSAV